MSYVRSTDMAYASELKRLRVRYFEWGLGFEKEEQSLFVTFARACLNLGYGTMRSDVTTIAIVVIVILLRAGH